MSSDKRQFHRFEGMELNLVSHVHDDGTMQLGFRNESDAVVVDIPHEKVLTLMHEAGARLRAAGWESTPEVPEVPRNECLKVVVQQKPGRIEWRGPLGRRESRDPNVSRLVWVVAAMSVLFAVLTGLMLHASVSIKSLEEEVQARPDLECYNVGGKLMCKAPNGLPEPETKPSGEHSA